METYFDYGTKKFRTIKYLKENGSNVEPYRLGNMIKYNYENFGVCLTKSIAVLEAQQKLALGFDGWLKDGVAPNINIGLCFLCGNKKHVIDCDNLSSTNKRIIFEGFTNGKTICTDCFYKLITKLYIKKFSKNSTINKGDKEMAEVKNEKFVKIEGLVTDTVGNLAIMKDGVAYTLAEDGSLVPVAAGATPDKAYAVIKVSVSGVKKGAVVIDPKHNKPVFVDRVSGSRMTFRDIIGQSTYERDFVPDVITGEATVLQVISVIKLVRGNGEILGLINRYGNEKVFNTLVNQYLTYGDVNATRIEAEINPAMIQLNLTNSMNAMTAAIAELLAKMNK